MRREPSAVRLFLFFCLVIVVVSTTRPRIAVGQGLSPVIYGLPVSGPIVDPYRPPPNPFGPGNRGIDIGTTEGQPVGAPADGVVTFAGQVGGELFVVIQHADGIRTTLGYLGSIAVRAGQRVRAGQIVGTALLRVHFGARRGGSYLDPLTLVKTGPPRVWLIGAR